MSTVEHTSEAAAPDEQRRIALATTGALAGVGLVALACPFVASMAPSARARAEGGPIDLDISTLAEGEQRTVAWRGRPTWFMRRSEEMVRALERPNADLADPLSLRSQQPRSCMNATRSVRPDIFVATGVCTHLGCIPILRLDDAQLNAELNAPGGFRCPCHGSRFDLAGRVVKNVPAPLNLEIPEYAFASASIVHVG
ncbi:MAG TPA: ubiquinol-cytochrome c reductase iron-sulfur subunit [Burkholderiaceae bacterium]|nr:ubiquinol-cytochrome c reductase iron-sulfur subunit [Burkholderiaceae bacterium]